MKKFTRIQEHLVFQNRFIQLFDDDVTTPSGEPGHYVRFRYLGNPPGVVIVPRLPDGRFLLLHIHRYAFDAVSLEFPRGSAEQNEEAESAARREMREETCLTPSNCEFIGYLRPDTAIVETEVQVFLMEIPLLAMVKIKLDEGGEGISSHELLNKQALLSKVQNGEIRDGFTIGAVGLLAAGDLL